MQMRRSRLESLAGCKQVCQQQNMGEWLWETFGHKKEAFTGAPWRLGVSSTCVVKEMERLFAMGCVGNHLPLTAAVVDSVPMKSLKNFLMEPWQLSFSENAKYGATGRFPANHQFLAHLPSFLDRGFESHREAIDVKFTVEVSDKTVYKIHPYSVGYVDGQNKALILHSILASISVLARSLAKDYC